MLKSTPCKVLEILENGKVKVETISDKSVYNVPNFSGSEVYVGENVQVFFKGTIISEKNAYIGASLNKNSNATYINAETESIGILNDSGELIIDIYCECEEDTNCLLIFNSNLFGLVSGLTEFFIYIDDIQYNFSPKTNVNAGEYSSENFTILLPLETGIHTIDIKMASSGVFVNAICCLYGVAIKEAEMPVEPTDENDYIFKTSDTTAVLYYIGDSKYPQIPTTFGNKNVTVLYPTSFNYSDIEGCYIPDGVEEIQ